MLSAEEPPRSTLVAQELAAALDQQGQEYAFGGALALGFWGTPRGTLDVDLTLFISPKHPTECLWLMTQVGCQVDSKSATESLIELGFCHASFAGTRVDVFVPTIPFYDLAKQRRRQVTLGSQPIWIWDAETLAVFKMMFFRTKDIADLENILEMQGAVFDRTWVREQIVNIFGNRDPRLSEWDRLVERVPAG
ncbi:MAG TPA: hypothetical protein VK137_11425 [Planctomycetaceae bacterium]|nr:hypothetical protein [Planctomycetaceae bacterium]